MDCRKRAKRTTVSTIAAALVAAGLSVATTAPAAHAVPGVPAVAFDPNSVGWTSYHDQTSSQFSSTFAKNKKDYLIADLEIDVKVGITGFDYRVGSVWQRNTDHRDWLERRNLTGAQFHDIWDKARKDGLRLVEQETYNIGSTRLWAGVWVENKEHLDWSSHRGQTVGQYLDTFEKHRKAGLMPVDYDEYATSDGLRVNTVWVTKPKGTSWWLHSGLSSAQFSTKYTEHKKAYRVLAFDSLEYGGKQRYAGIWISNNNHRGWAELRGLTEHGYNNYWHYYKDLGYRVVGMDRYETDDGTRYALIFRQNTGRPNWALRKSVDTRVQQELDKGAPGIGVAVYKDGVPVYLRGFGKADIDDNIKFDADHVGAIASVSKAVAGVLAVRLERLGYIDLDDATRDWVPSMPAHHTHTLRQLLSNRGCVEHYNEGDSDGFDDEEYDTALEAAEEFWDDPLVCTPGTQYHYSTHGYTLLAAALEAATGTPIKQLVRQFLTNKFGLGTLGPQNFSSSVHRMAIYDDGVSDPDEIDVDNNDWKVLGGGLDSSVTDLARFGAKLADGKILNSADRTTLWTAPDGLASYGLGWNVGTEGGTQVVAKDGSWTGNLAYLRVYPKKGISVAVMINSREGSWSASQLGQAVGAMVLAATP